MRYLSFDTPIDYRRARDFLVGRYGLDDVSPSAFDYVDRDRYVLLEDADLRKIRDAVR